MRRLNKSYPYMKQLKNRSCKNNDCLVGVGTKPIMRCVSNEQLSKWVNLEVRGALDEQNRRQKKNESKK